MIERQAALGEFASEQKPLFTIADLSTVWVDFAVYRRDFGRVRVGDDGDHRCRRRRRADRARRSPTSRRSAAATRRARWRARRSSNEGRRLRPGLFVTGKVLLSAKPVEIAVRTAALQTIENRTVVFVRSGDKFEAREVELGARDGEMGRDHVRAGGRRRLCGQEQLRHQGRDRQGGGGA